MLRARNGRVLLKCEEIEEDTNEQGYSTEVALSSGRQIVKGVVVTADPLIDITTGDSVYFPRYAANEFNYKDELLFSVHSDDIEYVEQ